MSHDPMPHDPMPLDHALPRVFALLIWFGLILFVAAGGAVALMTGMATAQTEQQIAYGATVTGAVTTRRGEEWSFYGCRSDVVTITLQSEEFAGYVELYGADAEESLADAEADDAGEPAEIAAFALPNDGVYLIAASGSGIRDRGPYSLTLRSSTDTRFMETSAGEPDFAEITAGQWVTGELTGRLGSEWVFRGCAGNVVTITLQSDDFAPYVELYDATAPDPLADGTARGRRTNATIENFSLPTAGLYSIIAAGQRLRDRGVYTLGLTVATTQTLTVASTGAAQPTRTPARGATATATATPTATPTMSADTAPLCTVVSSSLNLRYGPGIAYTPALAGLRQGEQLRPQARNADSSWIQVEVVASGRIGWVSASAQYITCTIDVRTLPLGVIPPLPAATATATPTPTSPPVVEQPSGLQPVGIIIQGAGDPGDLVGGLYVDPRAISGSRDVSDDPLVVRDPFYLELFIYDPDAGNQDGDGIDRVEFSIECSNEEEYTHTERTARYCAFGGGEPDCNWVSGAVGSTLPDSNCVLEDDYHTVNITAFPKNPDRERGNWNFDLRPVPPEESEAPPPESPSEPGPPADLVAFIAQTGPGHTDTFVGDALVFQVVALDPGAGDVDGAGIDHVDLEVYGPSGFVYSRTENNAHYCAFGGGEPDCTVFDLGDNENWPDDGPAIENGTHTLVATVYADDGRTITISGDVEVSR